MAPNEQPPPQVEPTARVRVLPPFVFLGWLLLAVAATHLGRLWMTYALAGVRTFLGAVLLFGGIALVVQCFRVMRETGQNPSPKTPTPSLIVSGPWRVSRNPMYLGMTAIQVGLGLSVNNIWIVLSGLLALWTVHRTAVLPEEAYLTERFGDAYRQYRAKVHRYL